MPIPGMLKVIALACGLLLVWTAQQRLETPEAHLAIGRLLGEADAAAPRPAAAIGPSTVGIALSEPALPSELLETIDDNAPFTKAESDAWFALLQRAGRAESPVGPLVSYSQLRSQPDTYRARIVRVRGTVRRVEEVTPASNDAGIENLYRLVLQEEGGSVWPTMVYTLEPPDSEAPFPTTIDGYFFKNLSYQYDGGMGTAPVIITRAAPIGFKPSAQTAAEPPPASTTNEAFDFQQPASTDSIGRDMLAQLGFDLTLFDEVADRRRLTAADNEPFYSLLDAVAATPASQLVRVAQMGLASYAERLGQPRDDSLRARQIASEVRRQAAERAYSVAPLFDPDHHLRGELMVFDTVVRRALWVEAGESAPLDGYYELHAFPPDSQNLPLVFCVRSLPAGFPLGDNIRQPARLAGFFFRQWAYSTRRVDADRPQKDRRQFAPLLVGRTPIPLAAASPGRFRPGWAVGVGGVSLLVLTAAALLLAWRGDRRYEATTLARYRRLATSSETDARADAAASDD